MAKLVPVPHAPIRIEVADGAFSIPDDLDATNPAIEEFFLSSGKAAKKVRPRR